MKNNKNFNSFHEAQKVLGEDFWDVLSDVYPMVGPRIDVLSRTDVFVIIMDIPGIENQNQLQIQFQNNHLIVKGEIPSSAIEGHEYLQQERFYGPFKRSIQIPQSAIVNQLQAQYKYGILQIVIPKAAREEDDEIMFPIHFSE